MLTNMLNTEQNKNYYCLVVRNTGYSLIELKLISKFTKTCTHKVSDKKHVKLELQVELFSCDSMRERVTERMIKPLF